MLISLSAVPISANQPGAATRDAVTVRTRGLKAAQVAKIREALIDGRAELPGGAVAGLWVPGKGMWVGAVGKANLRTGQRMRPGMQLPVGSVTKTLTGTIVLQEIRRGRLALDDRMSKWFPRFPKAKQITIKMLLNMTSGIADFVNGNFAKVTRQQRKHPKRIWKPGEQIRGAARMPRAFGVPGSQFAYSNTNTVILGRILEKVTGKPFEKLLSRRVLQRVGMRRSLLAVTGDLERPYARTYSTLYGKIHGKPRLLNVTGYSLSLEWSAGGLASTLQDMHRWARALGTGKGVLKRNSQRSRTRHCVSMGTDGVHTQQYCLAVSVMRENSSGDVLTIWHNGTVLGATSYVAYYPRTRAVLVVQANQDAQTGPLDWTIPDRVAALVTESVPELLGY